MAVDLVTELADLPSGPGLAAALGMVDPATVPNDRMLAVLAAQYRQLCHEQARMAAVLAEVGRCAGHTEPGEVVRLAEPDRYAPDETRAALAWTRRAADAEHDLAEHVVHAMPALHAAWLAGLVDRPRVVVFHRHLLGLTAEQTAAVCRIAVPRAPRLTTGRLAVLLRRLVLAVDPEAAERWYRKGVLDRDLVAVMEPDGTVTMTAAGLPADQAEAACLRVQDLAAAVRRAGHPGRIGQIRTDLFLGLLDGRLHGLTRDQIIASLLAGTSSGESHADERRGEEPGPGARAVGPVPGSTGTGEAGVSSVDAGRAVSAAMTSPAPAEPALGTDAPGPRSGTPHRRASGVGAMGIEVRVALTTLLGLDDHPGEIPGLGLLPAAATRARVALQRRAEWRFAVTDADGRLLSEGVTRRRPARVGEHPVQAEGPRGGVVEIHVPAALLLDLAGRDLPDGWGAVLADLAGQHARRQDRLVDLDAQPDARLPGAALRRHTEIRDRTCGFPGCRHPARSVQIDHTRDHAGGGPTTTANTGPLCDHDHRLKHRAGWRLTQPAPGEFVWSSPLGGRYRTRGEFLLPPLPEPVPGERGPDPVPRGRHDDGPILRPRRPVRPPRPPPTAPPLPDAPPF